MKTAAAWGDQLPPAPRYDNGFPAEQQLPRSFTIRFVSHQRDGLHHVSMNLESAIVGDPLNDNAYAEDYSRFHDASQVSDVIAQWAHVSIDFEPDHPHLDHLRAIVRLGVSGRDTGRKVVLCKCDHPQRRLACRATMILDATWDLRVETKLRRGTDAGRTASQHRHGGNEPCDWNCWCRWINVDDVEHPVTATRDSDLPRGKPLRTDQSAVGTEDLVEPVGRGGIAQRGGDRSPSVDDGLQLHDECRENARNRGFGAS